MSDEARSMLLGPAALYAFAAVALILTVTRRPARPPAEGIDRTLNLFLLGIGCQCLHFLEELVTGFHRRAPVLVGLVPWSSEFFVVVNVLAIAVWVVSAAGLRAGVRAAFFPAWFFAVGMIANGVAHPLLALRSGGYFPGLITSPIVGGLGAVLAARLWRLTARA